MRCDISHAAARVFALAAAVWLGGCAGAESPVGEPAGTEDVAPGPIRLTGTVGAVRSRAVTVPRLAGQSISPLVITYLVPPGTRVEPGDLLVTFDTQQQERTVFDRRAEVADLEGQGASKRADHATQEARDLTALVAAEHDVERAQLDVRNNDMVARVEAEKHTLALEQAEARLAQLRETFELKRQAAAADIRITEIQRDRAERAMRHAEENIAKMEVRAPFAGLVVIKRVYRSGAYVEILEGDEVRPGTAVVDIVDTSAMLVRASVNQADAGRLRVGQRATVGLDGFPELVFAGRVDRIAPLGVASRLSSTVRTLAVVVNIDGVDEQLLPDLTAYVEIQPDAPAPTVEEAATR